MVTAGGRRTQDEMDDGVKSTARRIAASLTASTRPAGAADMLAADMTAIFNPRVSGNEASNQNWMRNLPRLWRFAIVATKNVVSNEVHLDAFCGRGEGK